MRQTVDRAELLVQDPQSLGEERVRVRAHVEGQGAGLFERRTGVGGHQIRIEVLELARALHPDVAGPERVLQLDERAELVEAPVHAGRGEHQSLPALPDEAGRCIERDLARLVGVQRLERLDRRQNVDGGGGRFQVERLEERRRVPADLAVAIADPMQVIEVFRLGELPRPPSRCA